MNNNSQNNDTKIGIGKKIFNISLIYYIYWICYAIWGFFFRGKIESFYGKQ